jgi:glycopeptide antibiotics resistance protein
MKKLFLIAFVLSVCVFLLLFPLLKQLIFYLHPIVLAVVFFSIFSIIFFLALMLYGKTIHIPYSLFFGILILYTVALLVLLFIRTDNQSYHSINLVPFSTIEFYLSGKVNGLISFYNLSANVGLFIPYGILIMNIYKKFSFKHIFLPLLMISLIEIIQFITDRGSMDIDDLILNFLGFLLGYLFYPIFKKVVTF